MCKPFYQRETPMKILLLALLAGQNVHIHGPHGVAKSKMAERLLQFFRCEEGESIFQITLSRTTLPEDLLGPVSIQSLKQDVYLRKTAGFLPSAKVAFVDEYWNASGALSKVRGFILATPTPTTTPSSSCSPLLSHTPSLSLF